LSETLTIKNFGPIKDVTIDIRKVTVLIGEQATGKSVAAKLIHLINFTGLNSFFSSATEFTDELKKYELNSFWQDGKTIIKYESPNLSFENGQYIFSKEVQGHVDIWKEVIARKLADKAFNISRESIEKVTNELMSEVNAREYAKPLLKLIGTSIYIPAERNIISLFNRHPSVFFSSNLKLPQYLVEFGANIAYGSGMMMPRATIEIPELNLNFKERDNNVIVENVAGVETELTQSATGYQSLFPIASTINSINKGMYDKDRDYRIILEEPEMNLFPVTQSKIVNFLVSRENSLVKNLFLTTHSPYILTSLNNLISAFNAGKFDAESASKIIDSKYWVNPDDVAAYMMLPNGKCDDIMDRQENLIMAEKIDGISSELNRQFDQLLGIEFEHSK
jgi:hypothetical protein